MPAPVTKPLYHEIASKTCNESHAGGIVGMRGLAFIRTSLRDRGREKRRFRMQETGFWNLLLAEDSCPVHRHMLQMAKNPDPTWLDLPPATQMQPDPSPFDRDP